MTNTTINAGKMNFNVKTAKAFRDSMGIWHVFQFELADMRKKKQAEVKNAKGIIATDQELIGKNDFSLHDRAYYDAQIKDMEQAISDAEKRLEKWQSEQDTNVKKVESIFTKSLYKLYVASLADENGAWRVSGYTQALADLFAENGLTPAWDTLDTLYHLNRERTGTGNTYAETGMHMTANTEKTWRIALMGKLCDLMGSTLPNYKFKYILTKEQKKALKAQNK